MGIRVLVFQLRLLGFGSKYYMFKILYVMFIVLCQFHLSGRFSHEIPTFS
jgi:hypothetical protein